MSSRKLVAGCWIGAVGLWLAMGFSLGWYYTFTYYGRAGWPMPLPGTRNGRLALCREPVQQWHMKLLRVSHSAKSGRL